LEWIIRKVIHKKVNFLVVFVCLVGWLVDVFFYPGSIAWKRTQSQSLTTQQQSRGTEVEQLTHSK
jgi:hypothetical protein